MLSELVHSVRSCIGATEGVAQEQEGVTMLRGELV